MGRGGLKIRIFIGLVIVGFAFVIKCNNKTHNPYTDRVQNINMPTDQEIAIGLQSAPEMATEYYKVPELPVEYKRTKVERLSEYDEKPRHLKWRNTLVLKKC